MTMAEIQRIVLSQPAIILYESIVAAIELFFVMKLSKRRKEAKQQQEAMQEKQKREDLDRSLINEKRRQEP